MAWWLVERWEALRLLGRARLPCRARWVRHPASRVHALAPWRLPPLHRLAQVARGTGKPRTHCAARMQKLGCLKFESSICARRDTRLHACLTATQTPGYAKTYTMRRRLLGPCDRGVYELEERAAVRRRMTRRSTPPPQSTSRTRRSRPAGWWSIPTIASPTTATGSTPRRSGWRRG